MRRAERNGNGDEPELVALRALAWVMSDDARAGRLLALTGLDPAELRARADERPILAATMDFLAGHEPDLIACADALDLSPDALADMGRSLSV